MTRRQIPSGCHAWLTRSALPRLCGMHGDLTLRFDYGTCASKDQT